MKIIAWNINGLKSLLKNNSTYLDSLVKKEKPNIICMGEIRISPPYNDIQNNLYAFIPKFKYRYWNPCTIKNGYSGTAIFTKTKPIQVSYGLKHNDKNIDNEGRVITLEFNKFYLVHTYTPNSGEKLARLDYRVNIWDIAFRNHIINLQKTKKVIVCGDLNVANEPIDIKNPNSNTKSAGYTIKERDSFKLLLNECKLIDTYRSLYNDAKYTYWSYRSYAREKNIGWRIDYFLISNNFTEYDSMILDDVYGSDHAPIKLIIKI
jgi:exodeoxyribonuclease-3